MSDEPTTPDPEPDSPGPATSAIDWQKRALDNQAAYTKKAAEAADLRRQLAALQAEADDDEEYEADEPEPVPVPARRQRTAEPDRVPASTAYDAEGTELGRAIAEQVHGADALRDFDRVEQLLQGAQTVSDKIAAMEAYRDLRARSAQSAAPRRTPPAEGRQTRDQVVTPTVQTNRPDAVYPDGEPSIDRYLGGANGGVGGWVRELLAARRSPR